jgi:hypothetical protein
MLPIAPENDAFMFSALFELHERWRDPIAGQKSSRYGLFMPLTLRVILLTAVVQSTAWAVPPITLENLVVPKGAVFWAVKTSGSMRDGQVTDTSRGFKVVRAEKVQDGSVCHNYAKTCVCTPAKFRITPAIESQWHVLIKAQDQVEASCPSGVQPAGFGGSASLSKEESEARKDAIRAAKRRR